MPAETIELTPETVGVTSLKTQLNVAHFTEDFHAMADSLSAELIALIKRDVQIRFPRVGKGNERIVSEWMDEYRDHFVRITVRLFSELYPKASAGRKDSIERFAREDLLPLVETDLRVFLVRRLATRWAARQYTDGIRVMPPQAVPYGWRVPVLLSDRDTEAAFIAIDTEGNLLPETTSRTAFLAGLKRAA